MKHCGRWFSALWVATLLIWSQACAIARPAAPSWGAPQLKPLSSCAELAVPGLKSGEKKSAELSEPPSAVIQHKPVFAAPVFITDDTASFVAAVNAGSPVLRPMSRGPPARA